MSMLLEIKEGQRELYMSSDLPCSYFASEITDFVGAAEHLFSVIPFDEVKLERVSGSVTTYTYVWETLSGQKWEQELNLEAPQNLMDFDKVKGFWDDSQFPSHRKVREVLIKLARKYGVVLLKYKKS